MSVSAPALPGKLPALHILIDHHDALGDLVYELVNAAGKVESQGHRAKQAGFFFRQRGGELKMIHNIVGQWMMLANPGVTPAEQYFRLSHVGLLTSSAGLSESKEVRGRVLDLASRIYQAITGDDWDASFYAKVARVS